MSDFEKAIPPESKPGLRLGQAGRLASHVVVTPANVVFTLSDAHREAARHCLDTTGKVTFTFREVSVTDLLELKELDGPDGGVIVD